ncbi:DMT family transporter [Blautia hansenii]|uniref:DMT family transporter n=1 Tax=Blautia hansenii TaxID=1322 RepID=A0ABX2IC12_BLAHA|nr:DMT family transporter [Blautia hansenii]MCB5601498.1 DMT family transporter [Blautia hansenii]NSJ86889.1 DMT family transporter [Blautia hansenii]
MSAKYSKNFILLFITAVIWGVAFVAQSAGMDYVGPYTFNAVRCLLGGIVLIPCVFFLTRSAKKEQKKDGAASKMPVMDRPKDLLIGGLICGFMMFVSTTLQQVGIAYTTVAKAGFITALYIIIVPILGIFLKRKAGLKIWISVVIALVGLYLLCMKGSLSLSKGDFLILICSICFAIHIMVVDHFTEKVSGTKLSCIQFLFAGALSSVLMFLFEEPHWADIGAAWLPICYAGILSCGVAYTFQIIGQRGTDPTIASLILSLESVVSVLAGWILLGETLSPREILGCVLMFGAIILAQINPKKQG